MIELVKDFMNSKLFAQAVYLHQIPDNTTIDNCIRTILNKFNVDTNYFPYHVYTCSSFVDYFLISEICLTDFKPTPAGHSYSFKTVVKSLIPKHKDTVPIEYNMQETPFNRICILVSKDKVK